MQIAVIGSKRPDPLEKAFVIDTLRQIQAEMQPTCWLTDAIPGISAWVLDWCWTENQPMRVYLPTTRESAPFRSTMGPLLDRLPRTALREHPEYLNPHHPVHFQRDGQPHKGNPLHFLRNHELAREADFGVGFFSHKDPDSARDVLKRMMKAGKPVREYALLRYL